VGVSEHSTIATAEDVLTKWPLRPIAEMVYVNASNAPSTVEGVCRHTQFFLRANASDIHVFLGVFARQDYSPLLHQPWSVTHILDAGANIGMSAVWFATVFPHALVVAMEPEPDNYRLLRLNSQSLRARVKPIHAALAGHDGEVSVTTTGARTQESTGWAVRVAPGVGIHAYSLRTVQRRFMTQFDIIKIDIEGYELDVLNSTSAKETEALFASTRVVVCELHEDLAPGIVRVFRDVFSSDLWEHRQAGEYAYAFNRRLR
jgi:FkbM family methyltransferase